MSTDSGNVPVGAIDLFDFDPVNQRAGVGIVVLEKYRNNGVANFALDILIEYAFNHLTLHQLYCNIEENNSISLNLFRKKGFEDCGIKLEWNRTGNEWKNEIMLQLINHN
jgi:diamine N-acetyltransferase